WIQDKGADFSVLLALNKTEIVVAIGPRTKLEPLLPLVLGDKRPAKTLAAAQLHDVAKRDGYSSQGVGFLDTSRTIAVVLDAIGGHPPPACTGAIESLARRVPRLTFGYDTLSGSKLGMGMVVELAPDVLADAKTLGAKLPGIDRMLAQRPMM